MLDNDFKEAKETPLFSYRRCTLHDHSFTVLHHGGAKKGYEPVGRYTVLDQKEDESLSEKKIINLISLLNGKDDLIDLSKDVEGTRLYYHEVPHEENDQTKILFYHHDGQCVSKENALFLIDKEVWGHA